MVGTDRGRLRASRDRIRDGVRRGAENGASRTRTGDLLGAIQALSQLSYSPAWELPINMRARGRAAYAPGAKDNREMNFGRRLALFFVLIAIVPTAALLAILLFVGHDSQRGKSDARIAAGLQTALAVSPGR